MIVKILALDLLVIPPHLVQDGEITINHLFIYRINSYYFKFYIAIGVLKGI